MRVTQSPDPATATTQGCVYCDGRFCAPSQATVSAFDRGFLYGDGVFESLRTYGGRPFRLEAHLDRLAASLAQVGIVGVPGRDALGSIVHEALRRSRLDEAYLRVTVTRGVHFGGPMPAEALEPTLLVAALPLRGYPASAYDDGVAAVTLWERSAADQPAPGVKSASYQRGVLGRIQAHASGAAEGLYVGRDGGLTEGTASNLFALRDGVLLTPPADVCLPGITRAEVLELAAVSGRRVEQVCLTPHALLQAQEVFLTSSLAELLPVVRLDGRPIGQGRPGPVYGELLRAYRDRAHTHGQEQPPR